MSIIVKHRTDLDLVAERVGVQARRGSPAGRAASRRRDGRPRRELPDGARPARRAGLASARSCAARASRSGPRRSSTPSRRSRRCRGPSRADFREALAATLAKSQEDRRVFELLFDRYFFRAAEAEALEPGDRRGSAATRAASGSTSTSCARRSARRSPTGNDGEMRDLARLAIAAFGRRGEGSGVVGVDVQRIRRTLGLQAQRRDGRRRREPTLDRESLRQFERHLRRELERALIERTEQPAAVAPARRPRPRAADQPGPGPRRRPPRRRAAQAAPRDARPRAARAAPRAASSTCAARCARRWRPAACRCGSSTGPSARAGPRSTCSATSRPRSPRRASSSSRSCTRSTTRSASCAASSSSSGSREVTDVFERERDFRAISRADQPRGRRRRRLRLHRLRPRLARVPGAEISEDLDPRSTVIVLGDARTNGREPHAAAFAQVAERAGRTFWLNPEPKLYWNYGDSVMSAYEPPLRRRLRVLDDEAPREVRQRRRRRHASGRLTPPRRLGRLRCAETRGARGQAG